MKGKKRSQCYSIILLAFCLTACEVKRPENVLPDAKMENVLYDYHIAKAIGDNLPYSENYKRVLYIESVFNKYGISEADFDSSMVWYARNPEVLTKIYEKVNLRLKSERDNINHLIALRDNKPKESLPGDSINVWNGHKIYQLTGMPLNNKLTFAVPSDSNFHDRDTLRWNVRFRFFKGLPDTLHAPVMAMQIRYNNDSIVNEVQKVLKAGERTISLSADSLGKIKEIRGFIYYPTQKDLRSLLIDNISLMRYHATDSLKEAAKDSLSQTSAVKKDTVVKPSEVKQEVIQKQRNIRPRPTMQGIEKTPRSIDKKQ